LLTIFQTQPNYVFNHVAISVPNCDEASEWYTKVFGFRKIRSDRTTDRDVDGPESPIFKIYGNKLNKVKSAWLACGNGVGFEIFEFIDPQTVVPKESFEFARGGFFHIAVTTPDPDVTAKTVIENGGKQIGVTVGMYGEKALYVQDPWGNVIECLSCSFEQLMGNRG
jgi:catechol 2,3-dioxygenase-like lactoylglutathione lyase family enzyme